MKLLQRGGGRLVFQIGVREKSLLERIVGLYPLQPDPPASLTRNAWQPEKVSEAEVLLREALRDQRTQLADWAQLRMTEGEAFLRQGSGWRLVLDDQDVDRLLRVLNELRVGAWTKLGCPEQLDDEKFHASESDAPFHAIMTLAGQFEMVFIHSLDAEPEGGTPPAKS